jgi:8-oxo-dGTP diphosphatase
MAPQVVVGAAIIRGHRLLGARRSGASPTAGGWELPGGKVDPGENDLTALVREIREELGVTIRPLRRVLDERGEPDWPVPGVGVLRVWTAHLSGTDEPVALTDHDRLRWLAPEAAFEVGWLPADAPVVRRLLALGSAPGRWPDEPSPESA